MLGSMQQNIELEESEAMRRDMEQKSQEFKESGAEVYAKA